MFDTLSEQLVLGCFCRFCKKRAHSLEIVTLPQIGLCARDCCSCRTLSAIRMPGHRRDRRQIGEQPWWMNDPTSLLRREGDPHHAEASRQRPVAEGDDEGLVDTEGDAAAPREDAGVAELAAELEAAKDAALRAQADAMNVQRRAEQEIEKARKFALERFCGDLLSVVDNLDAPWNRAEMNRAAQHWPRALS
ncbi:MAG: hypothetical protein CM15mP74_19470 [Halieaceae bacterium]|nr:MAG: hypothetical protein CM15mP74_19470 [Halieaceae bacterium]